MLFNSNRVVTNCKRISSILFMLLCLTNVSYTQDKEIDIEGVFYGYLVKEVSDVKEAHYIRLYKDNTVLVTSSVQKPDKVLKYLLKKNKKDLGSGKYTINGSTIHIEVKDNGMDMVYEGDIHSNYIIGFEVTNKKTNKKSSLFCKKIASSRGLKNPESVKVITPVKNKELPPVKIVQEKKINLAEELEKAKKSGNKKKQIGVYSRLAADFFKKNKIIESISNYRKAIDLSLTFGDKEQLSLLYYNISLVYLKQNNLEPAEESELKSIALYEALGDSIHLAYGYLHMSDIYSVKGDENKYLEYLQKALPIFESLKDTQTVASINNDLGTFYFEKGASDKAMHFLDKAEVLNKKAGLTEGLAKTYNNQGNVKHQIKNFDGAVDKYIEARKIKLKTNDVSGLITTEFNLANSYLELGDSKEALKFYESSLERTMKLSEATDDFEMTGEILKGISFAYEKEGNCSKAFEAYKKYIVHRYDERETDKLRQITEAQKRSIKLIKEEQKGLINEVNMLSQVNEDHKDELKRLKEKHDRERYIKNIELKKKQSELELTRKTEEIAQKENEVATMKLAEKNRQQNWLLFALLVSIVFIVLMIYGIRKIRLSNQKITKQKEMIEIANTDLMSSIRYAERIQAILLPTMQEIRKSFDSTFVLYKPKDIVSGDFFWLEKKENVSYIAVVDCTGHGVPGAFVSIIGRNGLNRSINEFGLKTPSEILDKLSELVEESFTHEGEEGEEGIKDGMDLSLCAYHHDTMMLEFSGANNPLYLVRDGELLETKGTKQPIGSYVKREKYANHSIQLQKGDSIYLFTDGYADQFGGPKGKKFKYKSFKNLILGLNDRPPNEIQDMLDLTFENWRDDLEQVDDVCVMGIKF